MDMSKKLQEINNKLKKQPGGSHLYLYQKNNRLWLRGVLPPKPWLSNRDDYQQYLSLGRHGSLSNQGVEYAIRKVKEINLLLDTGRFDWADWVRVPNNWNSDSNNHSVLIIWEKFLNSRDFARNSMLNLNQITNYLKNFSSNIDVTDLVNKITEHKNSKQVRFYLTNLSTAFKWAVGNGLIAENEFKKHLDNLSKKEKNNQILPFSKIEKQIILNAFRDDKRFKKYYFLIQMLFYTGARPSEVLALHWKDVKHDYIIFSNIVARDSKLEPGLKTQNSRQFPINQQLKKIIEANKPGDVDRESRIFTNSKGNYIAFKQISTHVWRKMVMDLVEQDKIDVYRSLYNCRHTFITDCLEAGIDAKDIASWVGNSAKMIYEKYAGVNRDLKVPEL